MHFLDDDDDDDDNNNNNNNNYYYYYYYYYYYHYFSIYTLRYTPLYHLISLVLDLFVFGFWKISVAFG